MVFSEKDLAESYIIDQQSSLAFLFQNETAVSKDIRIDVKENASLELTLADFENASVSINILISLEKGASATLKLASILSSDHDKLFSVRVDHNGTDTTSFVQMVGINSSERRLEFKGDSYIFNGCHRSETRQEGKITNLNTKARSIVSPGLYIKDDDVKASHGASVGSYNPDALFYLMSRGLSLNESKRLVTYGMLLPVFQSLGDDEALSLCKEKTESLSL